MKKRIFAILTLLALVMFAGCKKKPEPVEPDPRPMEEAVDLTKTDAENSFEVNPPLFKVTDRNTGAVVYMMGSMHVGKPGAVYSQALVDAIDECDTLAVELDLIAFEQDFLAATEAMQILLCPFGTTVADYMGGDYESIVQAFTDRGLYSPLYEQYIPAMWSSLWSNQLAMECGYDANYGTDRLLLQYAKQQGKIIDEIESAAEQYQVEASASAEFQMYTLNQTIELTADEAQEQFDILYDAWKTGDIETLNALATEEDDSLSGTLKADYEAYYDAMYTNRQKKMSDYVISQLQAGKKTFVVVGAMHYAAPPSILDNLAENGYTVETLS